MNELTVLVTLIETSRALESMESDQSSECVQHLGTL